MRYRNKSRYSRGRARKGRSFRSSRRRGSARRLRSPRPGKIGYRL